jgi:hypothetical protein
MAFTKESRARIERARAIRAVKRARRLEKKARDAEGPRADLEKRRALSEVRSTHSELIKALTERLERIETMILKKQHQPHVPGLAPIEPIERQDHKGAPPREIRLTKMLGLDADDPAFAPYREEAEAFLAHETERLAREAGAGVLSPSCASILASAAMQLAASRYLFDRANGKAELLKLASALANDSKASLISVFGLAREEAKQRPQAPAGVPWLVASSESGGDDASE